MFVFLSCVCVMNVCKCMDRFSLVRRKMDRLQEMTSKIYFKLFLEGKGILGTVKFPSFSPWHTIQGVNECETQARGIEPTFGAEIVAQHTRTTTLWIVMYFSSSIPVPLSFSSFFVSCSRAIKRHLSCVGRFSQGGCVRGVITYSPFFPSRGDFHEGALCGKIPVAFYPMGKHICNQLIW